MSRFTPRENRTTSRFQKKFSGLFRISAAVALLAVLLFGVHFVSSSPTDAPSSEHADGLLAAQTAYAALPVDGKEIYSTRCQTCHQANGQGVPGVFPPLDGSEWVVGDKGRLIRIILNGVTGEIEVNGQTYSGSMPPWGTFLNDEEVAQLSTFIRSSWSNDTTAVAPDEVAAVRKATEDRKQPWKADELQKEENQGIPGEEEEAAK